MTLNNLIEHLTSIRDQPNITGNEEVVIPYSGGLGASCVRVNSVGRGIDFNRNQILIHGEAKLTLWEWYRRTNDRKARKDKNDEHA